MALRPRSPRPLVFLAATVCLLWSCGEKPAADTSGSDEDDRPPLVRTAPLELREVRRELATTGYLESEHRVVVLSEVAGRVTEVLVDEGDEVRTGQLMARLDDREAAAARDRARMQLEEAKVDAELASLEIEASTRREQQARIERNRVQADWDRLAGQDPESVSRRELDEARFALSSAEEALVVAGYELRKARASLEKAKAKVTQLEVALEEAEIRLADHRIVAPLDGVIAERKIRGGETISSATELFTVVDPKALIAYLSRPQDQLQLVRKAREVVFVADAVPGRSFTADVDLISPVVDPDTGHFRLRIRVRPADVETLRPGMFIRCRILTEEQREALLVPKTAILTEGDKSVVFTVRDGIAHKVYLAPGLELHDFVECTNRGDGGLDAGDRVVVAGQDDLQDQQRVEVSESL